MSFINDALLSNGPWQALERNVARLLLHNAFYDVRLVGQRRDKGADIIANKFNKRWLFQVKFRKNINIGVDVIDQTLSAARFYKADIPVVVTNQGFIKEVYDLQVKLMGNQVPIQLWDKYKLKSLWDVASHKMENRREVRPYQSTAISEIIQRYFDPVNNKALVTMATGLGKTYVAAEAVSKIINIKKAVKPLRILIVAHTNELVYQLEKSFWSSIDKDTTTTVINGYERGNIENAILSFGCLDSIVNYIKENDGVLPEDFDIIIIDECHHAGSQSYKYLFEKSLAGHIAGPFLLGLTATPWRSDKEDIETIFGKKTVNIDIIEGLKQGFLANIDYRMFVDNINWEKLSEIHDLTPKGLNRTLFVKEWDDAVVHKMQETWAEIDRPRAIVFCSTIDHALTMRDKINSIGFARAEAIYSSSTSGKKITSAERNKLLADFHDGFIDIICAVDIFNEGIDVPNVNLLVFQRVTHSRRIFVQQLGRGLRIKPNKDKVIVLDFVSDIRRFAAGLDLKSSLEGAPIYLELGNPVKFMNMKGEDKEAESFLKEWLDDVAAIQDADEDDHVLKYPPTIIIR